MRNGYTEDRRRKIKFLPPTEEELASNPKLARPNRRKVVSRQHTKKVMFLGVVACPSQEPKFDGRTFLKRVAKERQLSQASSNQKFTDDAEANSALKEGGWRDLYTKGAMTIDALLDTIADYYELSDEISSKLALKYHNYEGKKGKKTWVHLDREKFTDKNLGSQDFRKGKLTIWDVELEVYQKRGIRRKRMCRVIPNSC
jgi:hypothetical protein